MFQWVHGFIIPHTYFDSAFISSATALHSSCSPGSTVSPIQLHDFTPALKPHRKWIRNHQIKPHCMRVTRTEPTWFSLKLHRMGSHSDVIPCSRELLQLSPTHPIPNEVGSIFEDSFSRAGPFALPTASPCRRFRLELPIVKQHVRFFHDHLQIRDICRYIHSHRKGGAGFTPSWPPCCAHQGVPNILDDLQNSCLQVIQPRKPVSKIKSKCRGFGIRDILGSVPASQRKRGGRHASTQSPHDGTWTSTAAAPISTRSRSSKQSARLGPHAEAQPDPIHSVRPHSPSENPS